MNVARAHRILSLATTPTEESDEAQGQVTGDHVLGQMNLVRAQGILSLASTPTEESDEALDQVHTDHRGEMNEVSPSSNVAGKPDDECELATSDSQAVAGRAKTLSEAFELEARSEGSKLYQEQRHTLSWERRRTVILPVRSLSGPSRSLSGHPR